MRQRREIVAAVLLTLVGSAVLLLGAGRPWAHRAATRDRLAATTAYAGGQSPGVVRALGVAALAGVVGIAAARGRGRSFVGLVLIAVGVGALVVSVRAGLHPVVAARWELPAAGGGRATAWPWVAAAGGALVVAAGLLVAIRGPRWSALAQRYAGTARADAPAVTDAALWDALSRGDDPT